MARAERGWQLLQLATLLRALERHQDRALGVLRRVEPRMRPSFAMTLKARQVDRLRREGVEVARLAAQIAVLLDALPASEPLAIAYDDVRAAAVQILRHGAAPDAATVLLAAQMLDRRAGLPALAQGLRHGGAHASWRATVGGLIGAFRGVSPQLARRIATAARLAPGAEIADCHPDQIALLADELDLHAEG